MYLRSWFNSTVTLLATEAGDRAGIMPFLPETQKLKRLEHGLDFLHTHHYYREHFVSQQAKGMNDVHQSWIMLV